MLEAITWPVAISFVGTLVIMMTFLSSYIKKNEAPWHKDLKALEDKIQNLIRNAEHRVTVSEGSIDEIRRRLEEIKVEMANTKEQTDKKFDKTEEKLEKLTQLIIDMLQKF